MNCDPNQDRQEAHAFLDHLPPEQLAAVHQLLESMLSPLQRSLALAPVEDEPLSPEETESIERGIASLDRNGGKGIPMEEILEELGLTQDDLRRQ